MSSVLDVWSLRFLLHNELMIIRQEFKRLYLEI